MASWMVHLRVADKLLERLEHVSAQEFIMGNIAPDSGVPNADWSKFEPCTELSHFKKPGVEKDKEIDIEAYVEQYFTDEQRAAYDEAQYSFYLGYLTHLLTDILWAERIKRPCTEKYAAEYEQDPAGFIWKVKRDWYDLDCLYLKKHPDFRAFHIYRNAVSFENTFMDMFSRDAFENRREYITQFYLQERSDLEREYIYLTEEEWEAFPEIAAKEIMDWI